MNYIIVEGPEGLKRALSELLEKSRTDTQLVAQPHYLLYKLVNQQSLIRVDPSFHISHYDLLGRPATGAIKKTVGEFLRDECGERGSFKDVSGEEILARNRSFLATHGPVVLGAETTTTLTHALQQLEQAAVIRQETKKSAAKAWEHFGLFHQAETSLSQERAVDEHGPLNKPGKSGS